MERIIDFKAAYDKRSTDPKKDYGIHGVDLRMALKGELGAVSFLLCTDWHLTTVKKEFSLKGYGRSDLSPLPADISYHSPKPMYEGHEQMDFECDYLGDGKKCYCDGSGIDAAYYFEVLVNQGGEAFWKAMERYYITIFGKLE